MVDRTFRSAALEREVTYRVRVPARVNGGSVRVIYLLHGNGQTFREWSEDSRVAELAPADAVLVMPEGGSSYWMNSATVARDRYEDFVTRDLVADAERGLAVRERAIVGTRWAGSRRWCWG
jgi:poly(3-hydroxybutyrate) depolymerase